MTVHEYLSTGCLHGDHAYCQGTTGAVGAKRPAECKFCGAPCICDCHKPAVTDEQPETESPYVVESRLRQELEDARGRQRSADIAVTLAETALGKFLNPDACRTSIACLIHNGCHRCGESK